MKKIFDNHFKRIVLLCNNIIKNKEDAEDIAIDVFVELWKRIDSFKSEDHIKGFLILASKRRCLNYVKRKKTIICYIDDKNDDLIDHAEINAKVIDMLYKKIQEEVAHLSWRQKDIIERYLAGESPRDISNKLGIKYKTVCNLRDVAINTLKSKLNWYIQEYVNA